MAKEHSKTRIRRARETHPDPEGQQHLQERAGGDDDLVKKHLLIKKTRETYAGYINRGKKWLRELPKETAIRYWMKAEGPRYGKAPRLPSAVVRGEDSDDYYLDTFDEGLNCTPYFIAKFMEHECSTQKKGESTRTGCHAAFKKEFYLK
jgi:hypothetical protein